MYFVLLHIKITNVNCSLNAVRFFFLHALRLHTSCQYMAAWLNTKQQESMCHPFHLVAYCIILNKKRKQMTSYGYNV